MSLEELKYFFSYTRSDSEFVLKLAKELREVGANLWLDQLDILGGQHWDRSVEKALKSCKGMIAVLSPESVASDNVMDEVSYALGEGKLVVPILIRSCDIPFRLRRVQYIDFTADYDTGFSELLRALGIEQPAQPPESAAAQQPVVQDTTEPLEAKPTEPLVYKKQDVQGAEEPLLPKQSESIIIEQEPSDADELPPARCRRELLAVSRILGFPNYFYWYLTGGLLTTVVTVFGAVEPDYAAILNVLVLIPFFSVLLAVVVPIKPAYSSLVVTVATGSSYLGYAVSGEFEKAFASGDLKIVLLIYGTNVVLVYVVDFFRYRQKLRLQVDG